MFEWASQFTPTSPSSIKLWFSFVNSLDRIEICDEDALIKLDQVLKNQLAPAFSVRMHK
jgi:hypothetical protein